jgi:hypothetical protein
MKVKDENSRIRIHWSEARILGSGSESVPKCHGSTTLNDTNWFQSGVEQRGV